MVFSARSCAPGELTGGKLKADIVEVPPRLFLSLSGAGAPDRAEFASSIGALYGIAYGLKFSRKRTTAEDFKVGPLVGIWWAEGDTLPVDRPPDRDAWRWTVQLDMPPDVMETDVAEMVTVAIGKKGGKLEGSVHASNVVLARSSAQRFARILHVGPFSDEMRSFNTIGALLESEALQGDRWHIEVYLSDPQRTAPEKLKTVLLTPIVG
ncbi:MAG: GyrI-like domain-containing protein [Dehalococcoidia bacterium]|nr:GyrI-like domain-containing protein [Dehalococcoidia bacterium]